MVPLYPLVCTSCAGPCLTTICFDIVCPDVEIVRCLLAPVVAVRFVSALRSSRLLMPGFQMHHTLRISRLTLKMAPWKRNDLWQWMVTRSVISNISMAVRQLESARPYLTSILQRKGILSKSG